ncbi:MAG: hypothetical protein RL684_272 [Pseudomonadota bacterium]|jgi:hypothetical protein
MNLIFPVAPVIEHLRAQVPALKIVGASADLTAALTTPPTAAPAAYVLQTSQGRPPQWSGDSRFVQKADAAVQVVLWVRNYAQARAGASARADMDALLGAVGEALIGFHPSTDYWPLWFDRATDEHYDAGWLTSQITFQSDFRIQR